MNITELWPTEKELSSKSQEEWLHQILIMRGLTFNGFLKIEAEKGFLRICHLSSSQGQEMLRILCFRILEELVESYESHVREHVLEELIDVFNYLWAIPFLDPTTFSHEWMYEQLTEGIAAVKTYHSHNTKPYDVGEWTLLLCGEFAEQMRNRAWMEQPQDLYFAGVTPLRQILRQLTTRIVVRFASVEEFLAYFIAKDRVLQFRLNSKY